MLMSAGGLRPDVLLLAGCAAIALLNPPAANPDSTLRKRVLARVAQDPGTRHLNLDITMSSGVATVMGEIERPADAEHVLATVGGTTGVMDIITDLRIDDDIVRQRVVEALKGDPAVASVPVTVRCSGGEVTLTSNQTNADQRQQMVRIAHSIDGVVHVVDKMK